MNDTSTIVIMTLTLVYVITTNMQLSAMREQIKVMQNDTNLQTQPIPVPSIKDIKLEKIRPFIGPEDRFMRARIMSRFFCDFLFNNVGNGAALNVIIFPTIKIGKTIIPSSSFRPELTHCISDKLSEENGIHLMMFDSGIEIAKAIFGTD